MRARSHLLALLIPLAGCIASAPRDDERGFAVEVALIVSETNAPDEVAAREALTQGRYLEAYEGFKGLATFDADPARCAEFIFLSGEAALAAGEHEEAYEAYRRLLRRYPATPRYPLVLERLFLLGKLYAEGKAETSTWFFGLELGDRSFGVEILEEFQRAREQHPLADDALHEIGLARVAQAEWTLALEAWQKLEDLYPASEWAETAEHRMATTFVAMSEGVEYDKGPILTGLARLRRYVVRHPTGDHRAEADAELARLNEALAGHQLEVARFYLRWDRGYAAVIYLDDILREYPGTEAAREAGRLKGSLPAVQPPPEDVDDEEPPEDLDPRVGPRVAPAPGGDLPNPGAGDY